MEQLLLVHVCSDSVATTWPLLLQAVDEADIVALDLELSGLGSGRSSGFSDSLEERYKLLREVAASHGVLSVGVACFKWAWSENALQCQTEVFNIWLLCQREYMIDPKAAKFLINHGFDFNKQISKGLPYHPAPSETLDLSSPTVHSLLARLLSSHKPLILHNGWVDLLFLFHTFYHPLPPSVETFMADLSGIFSGEEEGGGGVFDTKAVAEYEIGENASFLEYIFRKSQRVNSQRQAQGFPHVILCSTVDPPTGPFTELVSVEPSPPSPGVLSTRLCSTFAKYGFCNSTACALSHDVMVVIAQEERQVEVQQLKRKRAREAREGRKKRRSEYESCQAQRSEDNTEQNGDKLVELFYTELEKAKAKLQDASTSELTRPSFGHRAGFDAFMTGYTFTCYALRLAKSSDLKLLPPHSPTDTLLFGVRHLRGCLGNRGKDTPLRITKSHFAKPSKGYQATWEKLNEALRTT